MSELMHADVFPSNADEVPPGDHNGFGWNLRPCKLCGAAVMPSGMELHRAWHQGLINS